jgi:hypothetical protein
MSKPNNEPPDPNFFIRGVYLGLHGLKADPNLRDANGETAQDFCNRCYNKPSRDRNRRNSGD